MVKAMSAKTSHLYGCPIDLPRGCKVLKEGALSQPCLFGRSTETRRLCLCQLSIKALVKVEPNSSCLVCRLHAQSSTLCSLRLLTETAQPCLHRAEGACGETPHQLEGPGWWGPLQPDLGTRAASPWCVEDRRTYWS